MDQRKKGAAAEKVAAEFLRLQGYEILERNFEIRTGEIDIIAMDSNVLVFVEVKYRKDSRYGYPGESVDKRKQEKIKKTAMVYMKKHFISFDKAIRFDVVEILGKKIRVIKHAF